FFGQGEEPGGLGLPGVRRPDHMQVGDQSQSFNMFHRLMGGAVFAHVDGVVGEYEYHRLSHQSREPDGWPHVVGEDEKGGTIDPESAMEAHSIEDATHGMFPDAKMDVPSQEVVPSHGTGTLQICLRGGGEVCGTADDGG